MNLGREGGERGREGEREGRSNDEKGRGREEEEEGGREGVMTRRGEGGQRKRGAGEGGGERSKREGEENMTEWWKWVRGRGSGIEGRKQNESENTSTRFFHLIAYLFIPLLNSNTFSPWGTLKTLITVPCRETYIHKCTHTHTHKVSERTLSTVTTRAEVNTAPAKVDHLPLWMQWLVWCQWN